MSDKEMVPTASPKEASANYIANLAIIYRLNQVDEINNENAGLIAVSMFEAMSEFSDKVVLSGNIDREIIDKIEFEEKEIIGVEKLKKYIDIVNSLFKLASESEIGAFKCLNRESVHDYDIKTTARAVCMGGYGLLDILCDIVNQELNDRRPNFSPKTSSLTLQQLDQN